MKKSGMYIGLLVAGIAMFANSAWAGGGPIYFDVPDGGSTVMLISAAVFGLGLCRKLYR